jgi:uncharacterized protein YndB with AHSA1/START domain
LRVRARDERKPRAESASRQVLVARTGYILQATPKGTMPRPDELQLRITRVLEGTPLAVWRALTEPDLLARWWGPAGFTSPSIALDLRVAGRFRIEMKPPDRDPFFLQGEYREVVRPSRLAYTFRWEEPDPDDRETLVTLSLADLRGKTELALEQGPFATEARLALHRGGWSDSLDKLGELLAAGSRSG